MIQNFYILGMGRSGTTLLQSILDAHTGIVVPPESYFVIHLDKKYKRKTSWNDALIAAFIDDLYTDRPFRLVWRIPRSNVEEAFEVAKPIQNFEQACNAVRSSFKESYKSKTITCFGDKKPIYASFPQRVMKVSPTAKIIHLVRDPRGTGNGQINTFKRSDALAIGYLWKRQNKAISELKNKYPQQYFFLKYEDLVIHTEKTIRSICEFLELDFQPEIMDYRKETTERYDQYTELFKDKHRSLLQPIDIKIAEKWKTKLKPKHRREIEYATYSLAQQFGYSFEKPSNTLALQLKTPISMLKIGLSIAVIKTFFGIPFFIRKAILRLRSRISDYKYWPEQDQKQ